MKKSLLLICSFALYAGALAQHAMPSKQAALQGMNDCFVENKGQWDSRAQFLLQKPGLNLWLTKDGAVFDLQQTTRDKAKGKASKTHVKGDVVRMSFVGAGRSADTALKPISGDFNYFLGKDPAKWRSHVHRYAEVHTGEIYKGIALRYYIDGGSPRYDLIVRPGADPSQVAMKFDGAQDVRVASNGSLIVKTPFGELEEKGLVAYQMVDGKKKQVACSVRTEGKSAKFITGLYDKKKPLVIDPLIYATFFYPFYEENALLKPDSSGNIFLAMAVNEPNFPTTKGAYETSGGNETEIVIAKISENMSSLLYGTYLGSNSIYAVGAISLPTNLFIDSEGSCTVVGSTQTALFPVTTGSFQNFEQTYLFQALAFVSKVNSDGSALSYSSLFGPMTPNGAAEDGEGNTWITGSAGTSFPRTTGPSSGSGVISELSSDGSKLLLSELLPQNAAAASTSYTQPEQIEVTGSGDVFVSGQVFAQIGQTSAIPFAATAGAVFKSGYGFLAKFDAATGTLLAASDIPTNAPPCLGLSPSGNPGIYISTTTAGLPTTAGAIQGTIGGTESSYMVLLAPSLTQIVAATYLGASSPNEMEVVGRLQFNSTGDPVVAGEGLSTLPVTKGAMLAPGPDNSFPYVLRLNPELTTVEYGTYLWHPVTSFCLDDSDIFCAIADESSLTDITSEGALIGSQPFPSSYLMKLSLNDGPKLSVSPPVITVGSSSVFSITLPSAAPTGGLVVPIKGNFGQPNFPSSLTIPAGKTTVSVPLLTTPDSNTGYSGVYAEFESGYQSAALTVLPVRVKAVSAPASSVAGGNIINATVTFTGPAPTAGLPLNFFSNNSTILPEQNLTVPSGHTSALVPLSVGNVSLSTVLSVTFQTYAQGSFATSYPQVLTLTVTPKPTLIGLVLNSATVAGGVNTNGTIELNGAATSGGQTVSLKSSSTLAKVPASVNVAEGHSTAPIQITTSGTAIATTAVVTATSGSVSTTASLIIDPSNLLSLTPNLKTVALNAEENCTVSLNGFAPTGGATVALKSSNSAVASVPATAVIPANTKFIMFLVTAQSESTTPVIITATYKAISITTSVTVTASVGVLSLRFSAPSVAGGKPITGTITVPQLMKAATVIPLTATNNATGNVPASVTIPAGASTATFTFTPKTPTTTTTVTVTGAMNGRGASGSFTVTP